MKLARDIMSLSTFKRDSNKVMRQMKKTKEPAVAFAAVSIGFGYAQFVAKATDNAPQTPAFCAKCGDGQCQKSCGENAQTCPRDCGGVPQTSYR